MIRCIVITLLFSICATATDSLQTTEDCIRVSKETCELLASGKFDKVLELITPIYYDDDIDLPKAFKETFKAIEEDKMDLGKSPVVNHLGAKALGGVLLSSFEMVLGKKAPVEYRCEFYKTDKGWRLMGMHFLQSFQDCSEFATVIK